MMGNTLISFFLNKRLFTQKFFKILSVTPNNMPVKFDWKHMINFESTISILSVYNSKLYFSICEI